MPSPSALPSAGALLLGVLACGASGALSLSNRHLRNTAAGGGAVGRVATTGRLALAQQLPVWIHGYARSGSSTILSMVTQAQQRQTVGVNEEESDEESEHDVLHSGEDCYLPCGSHGGRCAWCGAGACCRNGWTDDPAECSQVTSFRTGTHECVPLPPRNHGGVFSLFEPCHNGDVLDPELAAQGCPGLLLSLAQCRFDQIHGLHGWKDKHSKTRGVSDYSAEAANEACGGASLVAFKTISQAAEDFRVGEYAVPVLEREPRLHMIDIVRDPRSIYGSWMSTFPFNDTRLGGVVRDVKFLTGLCDSFAAGLNVSNAKVHRVVFEQLIRNPAEVMKDVYQFLQVPFGSKQEEWLRKTFDAKECPGVDVYIAPYSDCHTNATASLEKWRGVLLESERAAFRDHAPCQAVAIAYNYSAY